MTAATTLCGLQGVGRRRHHRFNQEGREAEGGQRSRATRIKGVESKVEKCLFLTKWFDPLDLSKQKKLLDLGYIYHCSQKGPYFRDRVPIGTFLTFWVPIGSLFIFQGPYFQCFG